MVEDSGIDIQVMRGRKQIHQPIEWLHLRSNEPVRVTKPAQREKRKKGKEKKGKTTTTTKPRTKPVRKLAMYVSMTIHLRQILEGQATSTPWGLHTS
jgi:hypothetical protein